MKNQFSPSLLFLILLILIGCNTKNPNILSFENGNQNRADSLFAKIERQTGFKFIANSEPHEERTESVIALFPYSSQNLMKAWGSKDAIDKYTGTLYTKKTFADFDGTNLNDTYEWETPEFRLLYIFSYGEKDGCSLKLFYTKK